MSDQSDLDRRLGDMSYQKMGVLIASVLVLIAGSGMAYGQGNDFGPKDESPYLFSPNRLAKEVGMTSEGDHEDVELIGRAMVGYATNVVCVQGEYAYIGTNQSLVILDVSTPTTLRPVGQVVLPGAALSVFVSGDYAYVAVASLSSPWK